MTEEKDECDHEDAWGGIFLRTLLLEHGFVFYCRFINCWEKVFDITGLTIAGLGHMYG